MYQSNLVEPAQLELLKTRGQFHAQQASELYLLFSRLMPKVYTVEQLTGSIRIKSLDPGNVENAAQLERLQLWVEHHKHIEFRLLVQIEELQALQEKQNRCN